MLCLAIVVQGFGTGTLLAAPGDAIAPVTVKHCQARSTLRTAEKLFNANGMADNETTLGNGTADNVSWTTGQGAATPGTLIYGK